MWGRLWASRPWLTGCGRNDGSPMPPPSGNGVPGGRKSGHRKGNQKKEGRTERNTGRGKVGEQIGASEARRAKRRPGGDRVVLSAEPRTQRPAPGGLGRAGSARLLREGDRAPWE